MKNLMKVPFLLKDMFPYFGSILLHGSLIGALIFQGESEKGKSDQAPLPSIPVLFLPSAPSEKLSFEERDSLPKTVYKSQDSSKSVTKDTLPSTKKILSEKKLQKPTTLKKISSTQNKEGDQSSLNKIRGATSLANPSGGKDRPSSSSFVDSSRPVYAPKPTYPLIARRKKWEGKASVRLLVDQNGRVYEAHLVSSSSHEILDQAALKALKEWRFPKACQSCEPRFYTVPVSFFLKDLS